MPTRQRQGPSLARRIAVLASALILSAILLPATIVAWYYASPDSFNSAISFAAAITDPYADSLAGTEPAP